MRVLVFPFGGITTPSSRVRAFHMADELRRLGADVSICGGRRLPRLTNIAMKFACLARWLPWCDVFLFNKSAHRTTYPVLRLAKLLGKKVVFDVDDSEFLGRHGAWFDRFFREADLVVAGSHFVLEHALRQNRSAVLIPTSVRPEDYPLKRGYRHSGPVVIGWTGTAGNLKYLEVVRKPLERLARRHPIELRLITDWRNASYVPPAGVTVRRIPWRLETANAELARFDIGLMPLEDTPWARGKCSFKAIEYMACGVPVVISAVGENNYLVRDGKDGFLARTEADWMRKLERLIRDPRLRERMGREGRKTIKRGYSLHGNASLLLRHLRRLRQP
jgi:glycosyltransferase involved in cell wall biosynthesis